jgi:catechol 2,3-dioxygenase-like lactoylglutathione lyase family enzyme
VIVGISHITFVVRDLELTTIFFEKIFEAKTFYSSSTAKYFLINNLWIALNQGKALSERAYNHVAFKIQDDDFDVYVQRINDVGAEIVKGRTRHDGEGRSIYFYDYDNHLFELHTGTFDERLNSYL